MSLRSLIVFLVNHFVHDEIGNCVFKKLFFQHNTISQLTVNAPAKNQNQTIVKHIYLSISFKTKMSKNVKGMQKFMLVFPCS